MGILISCINIAKSQYKTSSSSEPTTKSTAAPSQSQAPVQPQAPSPETRQQPSPLDPTPAPVRVGLTVEHLATSPPPIPAASTAPRDADKSSKEGGTATSTTNKMATDEDYMSFLDKANQDPNEGTAKTQGSGSGKVEFKTTDQGVKVPEVIQKVLGKGEAFYVSDADEPFVGVALKSTGKGLPDEATFAKLINHPSPKDADIQILDVGEWDTQGQYKDVVEATREAVKGNDVRVYKVTEDGSRVEYWVVGVEGGHLVGVKALAIES